MGRCQHSQNFLKLRRFRLSTKACQSSWTARCVFRASFAPFSLNNGQQIGGGVAAVVISTALIGTCSRTTIFGWDLTMASFQSFSGMILSVVTRFVDLNGTLLRVCSSASTWVLYSQSSIPSHFAAESFHKPFVHVMAFQSEQSARLWSSVSCTSSVMDPQPFIDFSC